MAEDIGSLFHDNERRLRRVESRGLTAMPTYESFRNLFINGDFEIDQRNSGAAQTITAGAALAYTVDRWFAYSVGSNATGQRIATATTDRYKGTPNRFNYRFTGAASNTNVYFGQRIEAVNCHHLAGQKATLQADIILSPSLSKNITWVAYYATTADTFGTVAAPTKVEFARGQWSVRDAIKNYTATFDVPTAAVTGIEIIFIIPSLGSTSQTVSFADVQFEAGPNPSPFEHRHFGAELALCQRYYWRISGGVDTGIATGAYYNTVNCYAIFKCPVTMRATPTVSVGSVTSFVVYSLGAARNSTGVSFPIAQCSPEAIEVYFTTVATTQGTAALIRTTSANYIEATAELST
jgi:hypothetical protein